MAKASVAIVNDTCVVRNVELAVLSVFTLAPWVAQQQIEFFLFLIAHPISQGSKVLKEAR